MTNELKISLVLPKGKFFGCWTIVHLFNVQNKICLRHQFVFGGAIQDATFVLGKLVAVIIRVESNSNLFQVCFNKHFCSAVRAKTIIIRGAALQ